MFKAIKQYLSGSIDDVIECNVELSAQLRDQRESCKLLRDSNVRLLAEREKFEAEFNRVTSSLATQISELQDQCKSLKYNLQVATAERNRLTRNQDQLLDDLARHIREIDELKEANDELSVELQAVRHERDTALTQLTITKRTLQTGLKQHRPNWKKLVAGILS